jgi:hypothetical protein
MDSLTLFCTGALIAGGLFWFVCVLGPTEQKGKRVVDLSGGSISAEKVQDNYKQYWSFFRRPKEIETAENVPDFVDTFYNLVTDIRCPLYVQGAYDSAAIKLRNGDSHRNFPWTDQTAQEPNFQNNYNTEAVLNMIRDGSYPSKFSAFLRTQLSQTNETRINLKQTRLMKFTAFLQTQLMKFNLGH